MTIRTMCEVCGKVVSYTNPEQQVQEAIDNPGQFCEGHIAAPSKTAARIIMSVLRNSANPDNAYFISKSDGRLISHAYINAKDGSYFPSIPKDSYEVHAGKKQARSYAILEEHLNQAWIDAARQERV
jgi:hypothetical protein